MGSSVRPFDEDAAIDRLIAAGATDEEIVNLIREMRAEQKPKLPTSLTQQLGAPVARDASMANLQRDAGEALTNVGNIGRAFASGAGTSIKRLGGLVAGSTAALPATLAIGKATGTDLLNLRKATPRPIDESRKTAGAEKLATVAGQMVGNLPVYTSVAGALRTGSAALAEKVSSPALKTILTRTVPGSFWKSAAVSAPANVVEGVIGDAIAYPEDVRTPEGILRSAAFSLFGTVFDGYAGSKIAAQAITEAQTPQQVKKVLESLDQVKPQGPSSPLPEGAYSRWIPSSAAIVAQRTDEVISGPMPTAAQRAWRRSEEVLRQIGDERLLEIAKKKDLKTSNILAAASPGEPGELQKSIIFSARGEPASLVSRAPTPDDRIAAAAMQNAIDKARESLEPLVKIRKSSGRAIDGLSFVQTDFTDARLTFEELDELARTIRASTSLADVSPENMLRKGRGEINRQQQFLLNVQDRLKAAAKQGYENMSVKELMDLEDQLLAMSRKLSEGFDPPKKKFIGDVPSVESPSPQKRAKVKIEEPDIPPPKRFKVDEGGFFGRGQTLEEIRAADDDAFIKRMAASDEPPSVTFVPSKSVADRVRVEEPGYAGALSRANIEYEKPKPVGPQPTFRQRFQDRNIPIRDLSETAYNTLNNLGAARRYADAVVTKRGAARLPKVDKSGLWSGDGEVVDFMPLLEIQREAGDRFVDLEALLKAYRTVADESIDTGMRVDDAKTIIAHWAGDTKMQMLVGEYKKNTDFMVDYMVRLGRISQQQADRFKAIMYAPLGRVFNKPRGANMLSFRKGSARKSAPIFEQTVENMYSVIERTQRNYAWGRLIDQWKKNPMDLEAHISLAGSVNPNVFEKQIEELVANGIPQKDAADWIRAMYSGTYDKSDGSLIVFENGIASKYFVSDALSLAVKASSPIELNGLQEVMSMISTPMRESVALGLDLSLIGPAADALVASARDPGFRFFLDPIRGAWASATKSDEYVKGLSAGLGFGARLRPDENILRVSKRTGKPIAKTISSPIAALNNFIRPLSEASRVGLYLSQLRQGATPAEAATFANTALGNWNVVGANMRAWSLMTEFGNVGIQSAIVIPKTIKAAAEDPKVAASVAAVGFGGLTMPTLLMLSAYEDDDEINALRRADNYDYWYWRGLDGEPQRMKKPGWWLVPIFSSLPEAAWDGMDSGARKRLAKSVLNSVMFNPVPISLQTTLGLMNNDTSILNPFSDIPIVPGGQQDIDPSIQGSAQNTKLSMAARDVFGISPFKTDYFLRQSLGSDLFSLAALATGGTVGTENRLPVLGRYSVSPRAQTEGSIQFYKDLEESRKVERTLKEYAIKGDEEGYRKYLEKNKKMVNFYDKLVGPSQSLAKLNLLLRQISADKTLSRKTKAEYEKYYRGIMNEFFREYVEVRKSME